MPRIPLFGRLFFREYAALLLSALLILLEFPIRLVTACLPEVVISFFYEHSRQLFKKFRGDQRDIQGDEKAHVERIRSAADFEELCGIYGYTVEDHYVQTKDGYLLCLHRIPARSGERRPAPGTSTRKPVVYLHHGLLMNSEVWVCLTEAERCIPFTLAEKGYDVWLGNNRGNKYSKKAIHSNSSQNRFWNYSMDEFCMHDIPDSIDYILATTKSRRLSYIGFSQGTAQAFAALSIHPQLNDKVNVFIALAPAMSPKGLAASVVDALMKASPSLMFLFFGRKAILPSTVFWQSIVYPPIFVKIIDTCLYFLFKWDNENISQQQKIAAYAHMYSFTSVKAVVHWFQIMRTGKFLMYDDDVQVPTRLYPNRAYQPARFPTKNITTPIVLLYGDCDNLVTIDSMLRELPEHTIAFPIADHEHLDILWSSHTDKMVIPHVLTALERYADAPKASLNGSED